MRLRRTRSRRPTASWPASGTRTATPDDAEAEERFKEIQQAYDALSDPEKRKQYDAGGMFGGFGAGGLPGGGFRGRRLPRAAASPRTSGDIFSTFFNRGRGAGRARASSAAATWRPRSRLTFDQAMHGTQITVAVPTTGAVPDLRTARGAKPGTSPKVCPRCDGPRHRHREPGLLLDLPALPRVRRAGPDHRGPLPDLRRQRHHPGDQALPRQHPRRRPRRQPHPARRQGRGRATAAARAGDLYVTTRVAPSPVFRQRPDGNLEVDLPVTVAEAIQGGDDRGPDAERHRSGSGSRRAPSTARTQRLRGEGPPRPKGSGRGDIHYRVRLDVPKELTDEQREAVEKLAEAFNGDDPRAELLRAGGSVRRRRGKSED